MARAPVAWYGQGCGCRLLEAHVSEGRAWRVVVYPYTVRPGAREYVLGATPGSDRSRRYQTGDRLELLGADFDAWESLAPFVVGCEHGRAMVPARVLAQDARTVARTRRPAKARRVELVDVEQKPSAAALARARERHAGGGGAGTGGGAP